MAVIGGVFVGAAAHSVLSLDLSVAAGALTAGLVVQCQHPRAPTRCASSSPSSQEW